MSCELEIIVRPRDARGRHTVIAKHGPAVHKDVFDIGSNYFRKQFREFVVSRYSLEEEAHGWIETELITKADALESSVTVVTANIVSMADIHAKPTKWFWEPYIPVAAITDLHGDPGEGKSTIALDIVARHSRGDAMPPHGAPDGTYTAGSSLLIQCEDDAERTTKPRLLAAGADVSRVHLLRTVTVIDEPRGIQLPMDFPIIERVIVERDINLVVLDVLAGFLDPGTSMNDDAAMRRMSNAMAGVAERTQVAFLILRHMNKKENTRSMYRAGGSIGIIGAARAAFAVGSHPEEPGVKVLVPIKHNLGPRPHSLTYTIEPHDGTSRIVWGGQTDLTASDVLSPQREKPAGNKVETAKEIIADVLCNGPCGSNEVETACTQAGISNRTYWRARNALGVLAEKTHFEGQWLLTLPSTNGRHNDEY